MYIRIPILDMNNLSIGRGGAVNARVVHARQHEHIVVGLFTDLANIVDIHLRAIKIKLMINWCDLIAIVKFISGWRFNWSRFLLCSGFHHVCPDLAVDLRLVFFCVWQLDLTDIGIMSDHDRFLSPFFFCRWFLLPGQRRNVVRDISNRGKIVQVILNGLFWFFLSQTSFLSEAIRIELRGYRLIL